MQTEYETLRIQVEEGAALLTLDDPKRRNALTLPMVQEIANALDGLEARDDVGAIVVTGAPPAFCAGADLSHLGAAEEEGLRAIYEGFLRIARSPLPTIAAVGGAAVGAGVNLALVCDLRLASHSARFDCRFLDLGLHPGGGHTWMLSRLAGPQTAAAMVLFGERLNGSEAAERGLAWRAVDDGALLPEAMAMARHAAAAPRELAARAKRTLRQMAETPSHGQAVEVELERQVWSLRQPAFAERLEAIKRRIREKAGGREA